MDYIITKNKSFFEAIGDYNYCTLEDMVLPSTLAIDTETTGLEVQYVDGEFYGADIFAIQIGTGENNYLIDLQTHNNGFKVEDVTPYLKNKTLIFHNACLPIDTEVLTYNRGWVRIDRCTTNDVVYGYDNGNIKKQKVFSTIKEYGEVVKLKNNGRCLRSTEDHKWIVKNRSSKNISYKQTQELTTSDQIVLNGNYEGGEGVPLTDDELRLFVWAITDGHIGVKEYSKYRQAWKKQNPSGITFIQITQSKPKYVERINKLFYRLKLPFRKNKVVAHPEENYTSYRWTYNQKEANIILNKINYSSDFDFLKFVQNLSKEQLKIFLEVFEYAEGNFEGNYCRKICQSKKVNLPKWEALQLAIYLNGYTTCSRDKAIAKKKRVVADVRTLKKSSEGEQDVFCLMTELSNFVIRQNNEIFLTGNCFDLRFFYKHNFFPKKVYDTFIASKLLYNGGRDYVYTHNFGDVMERELGALYDKSEQKNIANTQLRTTKAIQYCFNDVDRLIELARHLYRKIQKEGAVRSYELNCNFTRALAYVEMCGLPIDTDRWAEKITQDEIDIEEVKKEITEYIYDNLSQFRERQLDLWDDSKKITTLLSSPHQMIPVFKALGINVINGQGKESIKEDVINKSGHEFVYMWLRYQGLAQNLSTFGQNVLDKVVNGRIYTSFNPMVDTCRPSCKKGGINFLNFPAEERTRSAFVSKEGFKIVGSDYSGQENVSGADFHHDKTMVASINQGLDLHCAFARLLSPELKDLTDDEIEKNHSDKRQFAKSPRFAFSYGGNAYTIATNLNIPIKRANEIEKLYKEELHKDIYVWGERVLKKATKVGYIESPGGWKLWLPKFDEYKKNEEWLEEKDSEYWGIYKAGKGEYQALMENKDRLKKGEEVEEYIVKDEYVYNIYLKDKYRISQFFKLKSRYMRLCLNNPVQTISAHQTKSAVIKMFDTILDNGDLWDVKICNIPYDELVLEVKEELSEKYKVILENTMMDEGNKWLTSGLVKLEAKAAIGNNWYDVH